MSHRVVTETSMKSRDIVKRVLQKEKISFSESGDTFHVQSGPLKGASIDCRSGRITGDSDYGHSEETLGSLRQSYSEELCKAEYAKQGISITSRQIVGEDIVLLCRMA